MSTARIVFGSVVMPLVLSRPACGFKHPGHHILRRSCDKCAGRFQPRNLVFCGKATHRRQGAGVAHATAFRRVPADDECDDGFAIVFRGQVFCRQFFLAAPDLADKNDRFRVVIVAEEFQAIDKAKPVDRITSDADGGRLAQSRGRTIGQPTL